MVWNDLEHHGYLRVDVRPEELRGDWIAVEPGDDPMRPQVIGSWAVRPERPIVLRPSTPNSSLTSFHDVRRAGLPGSFLPKADERTNARRSFQMRTRRVATWVAFGVAAVSGVAYLLSRRRR